MSFELENLEKLTRPKKQKVGKKKYRSNEKIDLKKLLKGKTIKKTDKDEYEEQLGAALGRLTKELTLYYQGKSKIFSDETDLVDLFSNKKFGKILCKVLANQDSFPYMIFFTIADIADDNKSAAIEKDTLEKYLKTFVSFKKADIKKIAKTLKCTKTNAVIMSLASITYKECRFKVMCGRFKSFLNVLYTLDDLDEKRVAKVIKLCYPKKTNQLLSYILGEKPQQNSESFSAVTNAALRMLEKMDNDDRKELLKGYAKNRRKNPNYKRRINLLSINEEDYKKIHKTIERLIDTGYNKELFV